MVEHLAAQSAAEKVDLLADRLAAGRADLTVVRWAARLAGATVAAMAGAKVVSSVVHWDEPMAARRAVWLANRKADASAGRSVELWVGW
jgi:hypothetical protein